MLMEYQLESFAIWYQVTIELYPLLFWVAGAKPSSDCASHLGQLFMITNFLCAEPII